MARPDEQEMQADTADEQAGVDPFDSEAQVEGQQGDDFAGGPTAEVERLRAEKDALYQKLARVQADYQNAQRRIERDMDQRLQIAAGQLVRAFLPVIDNFERAMAVDPETANLASVLDGLRGTHSQWMEVLKKNGVGLIDPEPGTPFDPNQHEALMQQPSEEYSEPHVLQLLQKGYTFQGRMLRPAQVIVSRPA